MTAAVVATDLGRRYGRRWALQHCSFVVPEGSVTGLVGANGAGKTTALHLAVGLEHPTEGTMALWGHAPAVDADVLARVGFVAQDAPVYPSLTVGEHLRLGRELNPTWDEVRARRRIDGLGLDPRQRAGRLSGGQRAQLALSLAMAKEPDLLVLDEPVASLDPLARRDVLGDLMALVADHRPTVVLSSHLLSDIERVCDHLIVLVDGRVRVEGHVDRLLAEHKVLTGPRRTLASLPASTQVVQADHTPRQTSAVVRTTEPVLDPAWAVSPIGLEDLVLAYMASPPPVTPVARLTAVSR